MNTRSVAATTQTVFVVTKRHKIFKEEKKKLTNCCFVPASWQCKRRETLEEFMETGLGGLQDSLLPCMMLWSLWSRIICFKQHCANSQDLGLLHFQLHYDYGPFSVPHSTSVDHLKFDPILSLVSAVNYTIWKNSVYSVITPSTIPSALNFCFCKTKWMTSFQQFIKLKLLVHSCGEEAMDFSTNFPLRLQVG